MRNDVIKQYALETNEKYYRMLQLAWPGSSSVERCPEEAGVASSTLAWATNIMWYVYILQSESDGTFYTGMTMDVEKRNR